MEKQGPELRVPWEFQQLELIRLQLDFTWLELLLESPIRYRLDLLLRQCDMILRIGCDRLLELPLQVLDVTQELQWLLATLLLLIEELQECLQHCIVTWIDQVTLTVVDVLQHREKFRVLVQVLWVEKISDLVGACHYRLNQVCFAERCELSVQDSTWVRNLTAVIRDRVYCLKHLEWVWVRELLAQQWVDSLLGLGNSEGGALAKELR